MRLSLFLAALALAPGLQAEPKIALLGPFAEEKSVETLASQMGVDAHNALTPAVRLKLSVVNGGPSPESNLQAAQALVRDPEVLAVVLHGEAAAAPEVLAVLSEAKLASVAASSWATTRVAGTGTVWLSPGLESLADTAGLYARRVAKAGQVAVLDNGAPTSTAATRIFSQRFRALGGKVPSNSGWDGQEESLPAVVKALAAHWPQIVFYAGDADAAGRLAKAMKDEKALQAADLILLPNAFDPGFFDAGRMDTRRSRALFPCMDFVSTAMFMRNMGFAFPKTSPEYRAYLGYAFRKPGRWTSMLFDAVALGTRAVRQAGEALGAAPLEAGAAEPLSAVAAATMVQAGPPSREAVHQALAGIEGYRGIRGAVKFGPDRAPADDRVMVYYALNRVNKTEMHWREKDWGPPF
jgi:ABC-type branched-subunit amino acid transport system substrate-binding protein